VIFGLLPRFKGFEIEREKQELLIAKDAKNGRKVRKEIQIERLPADG